MGVDSLYGGAQCAPPDAFWNMNREVAELFWKRGDGGTVSTRLAEGANRTTRTPVRKAKSNLHALIAAGVGFATLYVVSRLAREPTLQIVGVIGAMAAAKKTYEYLERDRCE